MRKYTTSPSAQTASVREKWLQAVADKIEAELLSHRLSLHDEVDNVGTGFPLVDALCCGQSDLEIGRKEVKDIAEAVYHVLDASTPPAEPAPCTWSQSMDPSMPDTFAATCGVVWTFTEGGPRENGMHFCPGCGAKVAHGGSS